MTSTNYAELLDEIREEAEDTDEKLDVIKEFLKNIDGELINQGWIFKGAKTVAYGYHDQSLINHVRNGVFFLYQLDRAAGKLGNFDRAAMDLRNAIAMFVAHDLHKTRESEGPEDEFDIRESVVQEFVTETGLDEFAPDLTIADFWACACAHHNSWKAKTENVTTTFTKHLDHVRLADAFASSPRPEDVLDERTLRTFDDVFYGDLDLRYHQLSDVKGLLTNICNDALADVLHDRGYEVLTIYQDGCVYLTDRGIEPLEVDESFIDRLYQQFNETITASHPSFNNTVKLVENISTGRLGYYDPSDEDFFYAGPEKVLEAMALKAAQDGDTDDPPTDSMTEGIQKVDEVVPIELDDTRQLVGSARLVYGIHRTVVPNLDADDEPFEVTMDLFDVSENVQAALRDVRERDPKHLKSGGKWEYSYAIAQELLDKEFEGVRAKSLSPKEFGERVESFLRDQLSAYPGWEELAEAFTADIREELIAYFRDIVSVDGDSATFETGLTDAFDEYTGKRGGKLCTLCNRGTTGTRKSDMETKKSLTTLQAGFSNRTRIGSSKPEQLLLCGPCRIEMSLRNTAAGRREPGRLFFHFAPDYFYTPLSWKLINTTTKYYDEHHAVRMGRLAEQVFDGLSDEETYERVLENLTSEDGGLTMAESLSQGFDRGFGAVEFGYFKPHQNDTEFQFFGVFLALTIAAHSGLRVYVSENPIPDLRARDFQEMGRLGAGLSPVKRFYREAVELDDFETTLKRTAALIQLGYANGRDDSLFAKYLRATRNKPLPGSYLLKRVAQNNPDEGSRIAWNLMDQARYLDTSTGLTIHDNT